jgi:ribosomal protein S18 acetylase RimI-like enzyme
MIHLIKISPETVSIFKAVRLRALSDSPLAFSSTHAHEIQLPDEEWDRRSERWTGDGSIGYLAMDESGNGEACGLVACYSEEEDGVPRGHVISMWVDPAFRRAGVGIMLIDALSSWARSRGLRELKLMVTSVNRGAIDFYERIGFHKSGKTGPYPNDPAVIEYEMLLPLDH